jgi:HlyD family secretion protein
VGRWVLLGVALAALGAGVWFKLRPKPVTTTAIVRGSAIDAVYATASVEAQERVTVKAKVSGSVIDLKVREGDVVKKGDLLATIDSPALKFQLARGKADQWAASQGAATSSPQVAVVEAQAQMTEASLKNAREERDRLRTLVSSGAGTQADLDRATNNVTLLEAQLASQRAQAKSLKIELTAKSSGSNAAVSELAARLADAEVRAPIDGVVLVRMVEPGELVPPNGPLFKLGDVQKLVLECAVDESDIGRISVGKKAAVSLYAFPKQVFRGEVFEVLPDADRVKKSFVVKVRLLDAPPNMRSGMSAEVNIIVGQHDGALLAPAEAIDGSNAVWVLRGDRVQKQALEVGVRDMLRVEITGGLNEGDQVVVAGMDALVAGARVTATVQAPKAQAVPAAAGSAGAGSL